MELCENVSGNVVLIRIGGLPSPTYVGRSKTNAIVATKECRTVYVNEAIGQAVFYQ
jgi:hypothetical protein